MLKRYIVRISSIMRGFYISFVILFEVVQSTRKECIQKKKQTTVRPFIEGIYQKIPGLRLVTHFFPEESEQNNEHKSTVSSIVRT